MREFDLIDEIFAPLSRAGAPAFGLKNDTALWPAPAGETIVLTKDMMVEGRHFLAGTEAGQIARKLLRVNLSDLAASGAVPCGYLLGLAMADDTSRDWLIAFRDGLAADQDTFGIELWGGDTSGAPNLMLSLTAIGTVPEGAALSRFGARAGDALYVSGTIGDAALGLMCLRGRIEPCAHFVERLHHPQPRLSLGQALRGMATAAVDISDGLAADVGHLAAASEVGAVIEYLKVPLSAEATDLVKDDTGYWPTLLSGGEDYELAFTVDPADVAGLEDISRQAGVAITRIGEITDALEVVVHDDKGVALELERTGYTHFEGT